MRTKNVPPMYGVRGVKLPVRDLEATTRWYTRVLGWEPAMEFPDEHGVVQGAAGRLPGQSPAGLAFRVNPAAAAQPGLELAVAIETKADLQGWVEHLDREGVPHSPVIDATVSWLVVVHDPDGHEIHLITHETHGIDQTGRKGYGRPVPGARYAFPGSA
ncbi:MAG: VOC family protein [Dermatophilaceae bacterium]